MLPEIWGKPGWKSFHYILEEYPVDPTEEDQATYYKYIHSLAAVLPCKKCQRHMKEHLKEYPLTPDVLSSKDSLVKWGIDFHNSVNHFTGKPMMSHDEAICEIRNNFKGSSNLLQMFIFTIFVIIIILLIYFLFRKTRKN